MLDVDQVEKVRELLASGRFSQRAISRLTGVSRVVVHRIATGKRKDRVARPREPWEHDWNGRPFERCPLCGARVRLPCLACILRSLSRPGQGSIYRNNNELRLDLELDEKHRKRYEQVKAWREAQKDPDFAEIPDDWPFAKQWKRNNPQ